MISDIDANDVPDSAIQVLLRLIDDPDEDVGEGVVRELVAMGPAILARLRSAAERTEDALTRRRVTDVLHVHQLRVLQSLMRLLESARDGNVDVDLEEAMYLLDEFGGPDRNHRSIRRELDQMALDIHDRFITMHPASDLTQILAINQVMFEDRKFTGAAEPFYDPSNSYITTVFSLHRGLPIALSAIMLLLAERSGIDLRPVAMPFHFVVYAPELDVFVDAHRGGNLLERSECIAFIERNGMSFRDEMLRPVRNVDVIIRMMRNLAFAHAHVGDVWEATILHKSLESLQ